MTRCCQCGREFYAEADFHVLCYDCHEGGEMDGSTEQWMILRSASRLYHHRWSDQDLKFVADSAWFPWLCEMVLPYMETEQLQNLLKKVHARCLDA